MRQALSEAAVRVVLERYSKAHNTGIGAADEGGPTAEQVSALHEELSAVLNEELASALSIVTGRKEVGSSPSQAHLSDGDGATLPEEKDGGSVGRVTANLGRLLALAKENEQAGQLRRAEALHQVCA